MNFKEHINEYISVLINSDIHSLIISGPPGLGKSSGVMEYLTELGFLENVNYLYNTGYITPLSMYRSLEAAKTLEPPRILIYDDVDNLLNNKIIVGILKGGLADVRGLRTVSYRSSTNKEDDRSFEFNGKLIFILNKVPDNIDAIIDRSISYNVILNSGELKKYIEENLPNMYQDLSNEEKFSVWDKIKIFTDLEMFSFRSINKAFAMFKSNPKEWYNMWKKSMR